MGRKINQENIEKHITQDMEDRHFDNYCKQAGYVGNGIYRIGNLHSTDTRELFLMYVAEQEGLNVDLV